MIGQTTLLTSLDLVRLIVRLVNEHMAVVDLSFGGCMTTFFRI